MKDDFSLFLRFRKENINNNKNKNLHENISKNRFLSFLFLSSYFFQSDLNIYMKTYS